MLYKLLNIFKQTKQKLITLINKFTQSKNTENSKFFIFYQGVLNSYAYISIVYFF